MSLTFLKKEEEELYCACVCVCAAYKKLEGPWL